MSGFTLRDWSAISGAMLAELASLASVLTDYTEGAVARSILETVALEQQRQDFATYAGIREGIEVGTYKNFDFFRLAADKATGVVRFTRPAANATLIQTVPVGLRVRVPGSTIRIYETTQVGVLGLGVLTVNVPVRCQTAGTAGNTSVNTIVEILDLLAFSATITNPAPVLSGLDAESDEDRRARFRLMVAGFSKATKVALEAAARSVQLLDGTGEVIERVSGVLVWVPAIDAAPTGQLGLVEVYIDNGSGTASAQLKTLVYDVLRGSVDSQGTTQRGWIAAGIELRVFGVTPVTLDVQAAVTLATGFDLGTVLPLVQAAITTYLQSLQVFKPAVLAEMITVAMEVDGVTDIRFFTPTTNVLVSFTNRLIPGTVTITAG